MDYAKARGCNSQKIYMRCKIKLGRIPLDVTAIFILNVCISDSTVFAAFSHKTELVFKNTVLIGISIPYTPHIGTA